MGDNGHDIEIYSTNVIRWLWQRYSILSKGLEVDELSTRLGKDCYFRLRDDEIEQALNILKDVISINEDIFFATIEREKNGHNGHRYQGGLKT